MHASSPANAQTVYVKAMLRRFALYPRKTYQCEVPRHRHASRTAPVAPVGRAAAVGARRHHCAGGTKCGGVLKGGTPGCRMFAGEPDRGARQGASMCVGRRHRKGPVRVRCCYAYARMQGVAMGNAGRR